MQNIAIFFIGIVATISLVSTIPSSYAETTYNVYVEPLPEFGSFAQSSVPVALDWWEQQRSDVKFNIVSNPESADFMIQWVKDFGTEVIGYAYGNLFIEVGLGDSTVSETWYPYSTNYVTEIVKHEVGHILGYEHTNNPQDIMYPVSAGTEYGLIEVSFDLLPGEAQFLPVYTLKDATTINYQVNSENADYGFDVYVVPSEADLDKWASYAPFNYYQDRNCFAENVFHISGTCDVEYGSGLLIISNEQEANKRTYYDVKMTEKSIKIDNVLSSAPTSSVPTSSSNVITTGSSSYSLYVDEQGRFSIEYPSNWFVYNEAEFDQISFFDDEYSWSSHFSVEGFLLEDVYQSTTNDGILKELIEYEREWCDTSTYDEWGFICYNFEVLNSDIRKTDSGQNMYLISEKYTNQYSDPNFPGEYPMTGVVAEIHDGTNGWIIYAESDDDTYEVHKEQITHFIKSFSLTVTSDTHLALVESPSSVTPPIATPAPMPIPTPEAPISLPSQSKTIEGAFLNIEKSEISISQSDELIQLYGNIGREPNKGERVIINIVYPDGTTNGHTLIPSKDGYFEIPERIDRNSPIGTYQFDAMLRDSFIGKTTLIVNEYSYASQSSTTTTEVSPSVINPTMPPVNQLTNESDYSITTKESGETSQTTQKYTSGIFDDGYQDDEVWFNIPEGWIITGEPRGEEGLMIQHPDYDGLVMVGIDFSRYSLDAEIEKFQNEALESASSCDFKWETKEYNNSVDWSDGTYDFYFTEFECDYDGVGQKIDIVGQSILMKTGEKIITFFYMANVDEKGILSDTYSSIWDTFGFEPEISISQKSSEGGGCLIATAAFGSEMAPQVQFLREIRDNTVMSTESGTTFMTGFNQFYYSFSPAVADLERENPVFKETVKVALTPMLTSLTLLNYVDVDTEEEMLGYGIGIILLNIGMYFVAPAVLIIALKKRLDSFRGQ